MPGCSLLPPARDVIVEIACAAFRALLAPLSVLFSLLSPFLPHYTSRTTPSSSPLIQPVPPFKLLGMRIAIAFSSLTHHCPPTHPSPFVLVS